MLLALDTPTAGLFATDPALLALDPDTALFSYALALDRAAERVRARDVPGMEAALEEARATKDALLRYAVAFPEETERVTTEIVRIATTF